MGQGNIRDGLDFSHLQNPQIGLPLVEPIERIVVRAQILRQPAMASKGAVEHPTECDAIDRSRLDAEPNDPARVLIHDDQDPVGPQRSRLALEQIQRGMPVAADSFWGAFIAASVAAICGALQVRFILPHLAMWLKNRVYSV